VRRLTHTVARTLTRAIHRAQFHWRTLRTSTTIYLQRCLARGAGLHSDMTRLDASRYLYADATAHYGKWQ
jgi:hypothetical protein